MLITFGSGKAYVSPLSDAYGNAIAIPTPVEIGGMQEFSFEMSGDTKEFHGQGRFPIAVAQGKVKANGKFKGAVLDGRTLNSLFFGSNMSSGTMTSVYADQAGTTVAASVTVAPPNSGTVTEDLGVSDSLGRPMVRVASAPTTGQYAVNIATGVYTFAAADVGKKVYIDYRYSFASALAKSINLENLEMGTTARMRLVYEGSFNGGKGLLLLESVIVPKLHLFGSKNDDFSVPELEYTAQANAAGTQIGTLWVTE